MKTLTLFFIGTGTIGSTLLQQIEEQHENLQRKKSICLTIAGIANSHSMVNKTSINLQSWKTVLEKQGEETHIPAYLKTLYTSPGENKILIDCTASESIPLFYPEILKQGISIVAANKKGTAGSLELYNNIKAAERKSNKKFLYETTVGAGLPVIKTLHNLIDTGDTIQTIEGVFSGTLSYIFNTFSDHGKFSNIVKEAKEKGYTEPDLRDDLNGLDVGRKLLILAREIGCQIELSDISIENLISEKARYAESIASFFALLQQEDRYFEKIKKQAKQQKKVMRYTGKILMNNTPEFSCSLQLVDPSHPFYTLSGSDNIFAIYSKRYAQTPLVIKGPGAGAQVTAAGVFADTLSFVD